jgi:CelD/BcsL family acetyltransferase involved in cellulose biosynthesis
MYWEFHPATRFGELAPRWNELAARSVPLAPFLNADFVAAALRAFGSGRELVAFGRAGADAEVAAIVCRERAAVWRTFQPSQIPLGAWVATRADIDWETAVVALLRRLPGIALRFGVTQQDPLLITRPSGSRVASMDYIETSWVDVGGAFDAYWDARGKNLRQNMRKQHRRLAEMGIEPELRVRSDPADIAEAVAAYGRLESRGWKAAHGTAVTPDNAQGRFYTEALTALARRGEASVYELWFRDRHVASDMTIRSARTLVILKTTYDETVDRQFSPALLLREQTFRQFFESRQVQRIEFYGRLMPWHLQWSTGQRTLFHVNVDRAPALTRALRWAISRDAGQPRANAPIEGEGNL